MTTATEAISTPLLIAGAERPGAAGTFPVYDPARADAVIGHAAAASADDALAAVADRRGLYHLPVQLAAGDPRGVPAARVLGDAVLDEAAFAKMSGATFMTTGQVCMALKRLYVPRARYAEVIDGLRATLTATRVGPGLDPGTTMGPLNTARQRDHVAGLVEQARAAGTEVLTFGEHAGDRTSGNYLLPSLVIDPAPELGIVAEEQFGPALPVIPYDDEHTAIRGQIWPSSSARPLRAAPMARRYSVRCACVSRGQGPSSNARRAASTARAIS